jgi:hypothetical protein
VAVEDVLVSFLMNDAAILRHEAFSKLKVPLSEFEILEKEERMRVLIAELERNPLLSRKHGVDRFELLLEPFGLGGTIDAEVKKGIREMHHVRNVLVHRGGRADRRLVEGCPWLGLELGRSVTINHDAFGRYLKALISYVTELLYRIHSAFGTSRRPTRQIEGKPD